MLRNGGRHRDGWMHGGGERLKYIKGWKSASFLSVSKQLTIEGQRRRGERRQYGNTEYSFIQPHTGKKADTRRTGILSLNRTLTYFAVGDLRMGETALLFPHSDGKKYEKNNNVSHQS